MVVLQSVGYRGSGYTYCRSLLVNIKLATLLSHPIDFSTLALFQGPVFSVLRRPKNIC